MCEVTLAAVEEIDIEPGGWFHRDNTAQMRTKFKKLSTGRFLSAGQTVWNRFTGFGLFSPQSMYRSWKAASKDAGNQTASWRMARNCFNAGESTLFFL